MPARKQSKAKKSSSQSSKSSSSASSIDRMSFSQARSALETSYTLHLFLLLIMTVLSGLLLWIVVKQQYQIDSLNFQLRFIRDRYELTRTWNGELLESKSNGESPFAEDTDMFEFDAKITPDGE